MMRSITVAESRQEFPVGKILCLGQNYAAHAREMKSDVPTTPVVFLKPPTALLRDGEAIVLPSISREVHHEVELVVAIGTGGRRIPRQEAYRHVLGYGIGLDMTLRDLQSAAKAKGQPWCVSKGFDTSAPVSPIVPAATIADPHALTIQCMVNGTTRQRASTGSMIFRIDAIIEYLSSIFTLEPGDLIFTGTPEGVGKVIAGDRIDAELVGFTRISHPVVAETS